MEEYKRLTNEELNDFTSRVVVQLEPTLTQQVMSLILELTEYRTKIENGTLIELPCKVGDKVYHIDCYPHIFEDIVDEIWINGYNEVCYDFRKGCRYLVSEFGVKWFTNKAKALKKLKELEGELK
jgi:hypothetical protein